MRVRLNRRALAGIVAVLSTLGLATMGMQPVHADPAFVASFAGVGSDTTMSVMDAMSGAAPFPPYTLASPADIFYLPIHSSVASGQKTISSWDAIPQGGSSAAPGCVTTKLGGPTFDRPDGSGNGINALRAAIGTLGTNWQGPISCTGAQVNVSGQIDFARSSRGPNNTTTADLTFIPFARDALTFAYLNKGTDNITQLTTAQLTALYSSGTGTITVGSTVVKACLANTGSGTTAFWVGALGVSIPTAQAAATAAGCFVNPGVEEHDGDAFYAKANSITAAGEAAVINFSVSNWIAQANGPARDRSATARANGVDLGDIDSTASGLKPYNGSIPNLTPDAAYYNHSSGTTVGTFGRNVYNVFPTTKIGSGFSADAALKSLFVGPTAVICGSDAGLRITKFGFLTIGATCGTTTLTGKS